MHSTFWQGWLGWLGVNLFFVLSGYLITSIALKEEEERGRVSLRAFLIRRSFRIFPLYYFVLGTYVVLILGVGLKPGTGPSLVSALPYFVSYLQEFPCIANEGIPFCQTWSLAIEEKFYLVWPALAFGLLYTRRHLRLPVAVLLAVAAPFFGIFVGSYGDILTGCVLALALQKPAVRAAFAGAGRYGAYLAFAALALVHALVMPGLGPKFTLVYSAVAAACLGFLALVPSAVTTLLSWAPLAFVGRLSYGVFLLHRLALNPVEDFFGDRPVVNLMVTFALALAGAAVLRRWAEQPLVELGRKLSSQYLCPLLGAKRDSDLPASAAVAGAVR